MPVSDGRSDSAGVHEATAPLPDPAGSGQDLDSRQAAGRRPPEFGKGAGPGRVIRLDAVDHASVMDSLPANIAVLDRNGRIVAVNAAWRNFAEQNGLSAQSHGVGQNYLEICRAARGEGAQLAREVASGIQTVLAGECGDFSSEYPCNGPAEERWFRMLVTPLGDVPGGGAVVMHVDITERRRAEDELNRTGQLLSIACRAARIGGWSVDLSDRSVEWSREACEIYELPPGTAPDGEEALAFYAAEGRDEIRRHFATCARDGTSFEADLEVLTPRGSRKWIRVIGEAVRDADGAIIGMHGAVKDLSPIKETEAALLDSERRFEQLVETLPQIVWTAEADGTVDFVSRDFYRVTGLSNTPAPEWLEGLHPDDRRRTKRAWKEAVARGDDYQLEFRLYSAADGDYRWHLDTGRPVRDASGKIVKWFGGCVDIHDRWLAEEALTEAQVRNQLILAAVSSGIHGVDSSGRVVFDNPAALEMLGYDGEELLGKEGHALLHHHYPDGHAYPAEECPIRQTLADGQTRHVDDEIFFRKDGTSFPVEYTCAPILDSAAGTIAGAVVNFRDITERKRGQELRRVEVRVLDMISTGAPLGEILDEIAATVDRLLPGTLTSVFLAGDDGRLRFGAAPGLPASFGAALDGRPIAADGGCVGAAAYHRRQIVVTDVEEAPSCAEYRRFAREHGIRACWAVPIVSGRNRLLAAFAMHYREARAPSSEEIDLIEHIAQFARTAIERTRYHEDLRIGEERFRIVARATSDVVWDWDLVADTVWWSDGMLARFGHDPATLAPGLRSLSDQIHPDDRERIVQGIRSVVERSETAHWWDDCRFLHADGSVAHVAICGFIIRDSDGRTVRMAGSLEDVTEQRRLEERLHQSQRLEAVGNLTGGVAHDFNNLLTVILGCAEILESSLRDDDRLRMLAEMTRTAAERGSELTGRLLAFSRRQPLHPKPTDVNRLLAGMESLLHRTLGEPIDLEILSAPDLWPALIDEAQLENAILNLCINARDAMPEGGRLIVETATAEVDDAYAVQEADIEPGQYVMISVSDTGTGMNTETIARAFEPFFTTKETGKGSGLGLSMVYGFAKQSSGHVRIYSEPGRGTTVKLYVPRAGAKASESVVAASDEAHETGEGRILFVEDNELVRGHVAAQLGELGYDVITAVHGAEAMSILGSGERFDLLFTDVVMPGGLSGQQLADRAQQMQPGLPVLLTSGYTEHVVIQKDRLEEGVYFLRKPFRRKSLAEKLRLILDGARSRASA